MKLLSSRCHLRAVAMVPLLLAVTAHAAFAGLFMKIETSYGSTINGEVTKAYHKDWIELTSLQFGVAAPASLDAFGVTSGKSSASELTVGKLLDRASPLLFLACAKGDSLNRITIEMTAPSSTANESVYFRIVLENVVISKVATTSGNELPSESVSFVYGSIEMEYFQIKPDGNMLPASSGGWDFIRSRAK